MLYNTITLIPSNIVIPRNIVIIIIFVIIIIIIIIIIIDIFDIFDIVIVIVIIIFIIIIIIIIIYIIKIIGALIRNLKIRLGFHYDQRRITSWFLLNLWRNLLDGFIIWTLRCYTPLISLKLFLIYMIFNNYIFLLFLDDYLVIIAFYFIYSFVLKPICFKIIGFFLLVE